MNDTLTKFYPKRKSLYEESEEIGDFRRGTISVNYRKCGKKNCICAKPGHPGHGPQYLWNTTIKGKSYAKNLRLGPELKKYMGEIANYRSFLKICDLRAIPVVEDKNEEEDLKKKYRCSSGENTERG